MAVTWQELRPTGSSHRQPEDGGEKSDLCTFVSPALEDLTSGSNQKTLSNLFINNQQTGHLSKNRLLTPCPRQASAGITFSWAMHCRIRGAPYRPPMQEARDEMYKPKRNRKPTRDTCMRKQFHYPGPDPASVPFCPAWYPPSCIPSNSKPFRFSLSDIFPVPAPATSSALPPSQSGSPSHLVWTPRRFSNPVLTDSPEGPMDTDSGCDYEFLTQEVWGGAQEFGCPTSSRHRCHCGSGDYPLRNTGQQQCSLASCLNTVPTLNHPQASATVTPLL